MISASIKFTFPANAVPERGFYKPTEKENVSRDPKVLPTKNANATFTVSSEVYAMRGNGKLSIQNSATGR